MKQTTKSLVTLAVLLGVAAAVGGVAFWVQKDEKKQTEKKDADARVFDFSAASARELKIEIGGKLIAQASRKDAAGPWMLVQPVAGEADDSTVQGIVDQLASVKSKSTLSDLDPKEAGLSDPPRARVSVKDDKGQEHALRLGEENSFDSSIYIQREGEKAVRTAEPSLRFSLAKQLFDLRDKRVSHLDPAAEVRGIRVTGPRASFSAKKEGSDWKLSAPLSGRGEATVIEAATSSLKALRATGIAAEAAGPQLLATYGLDKPLLTVELEVASGKDSFNRTIHFGAPASEWPAKKPAAKKGEAAPAPELPKRLYAIREGNSQVFEVDPGALTPLTKSASDLMDKTLTKVDHEAIRKLVFTGDDGQEVAISRSHEVPADGGYAPDKYALVSPSKPGTLKDWKASSALYTLGGLRAAELGPASPSPAELTKDGFTHARRYALFGEGNKLLVRVEVGGQGGKDGKQRWVRVEGDPRLSLVDGNTIDQLPKSLADVLDTKAADPAPAPSAALSKKP